MDDHLTGQRTAGKRDTSSHHRFAAGVRGRRVAAESALSRYLTENEQVYIWKGLANPAALKIKAKLVELGIK